MSNWGYLVTGGAGYIGSHTIIELINNDHSVVVVDNLSNSSSESLRRAESITGVKIPLHEIDLRNTDELEKVFAGNNFGLIPNSGSR
jgi:UDP-glucose 4-epimerase